MMRRFRNDWSYLALAGILALSASGGPAIAQHSGGHAGGHAGGNTGGGAHQHFDGRYSHNQYYYNHGYTVRTPPAGGIGELTGRDGGRYWFHGGNWYRWRGGGWVVWGAPIGLFVPFLPPYFATVWWDGIPYYYANDVYYLWNDDQHQYEVVAPPAGIESGGSTEAPASDQLFVYPKNGQSEDQQSKDRFECNRWAVDKSGFDPTQAGSGAAPGALDKRNEYFRAQVACLEGRGYTVK
ncbi:MAG: DUF6515 family protein [Steroidobacteraceae bacterium]